MWPFTFSLIIKMVPKCLGEKLICLHHFEFTIQASEMLHIRFIARILHSLMTLSCLIYVPMHLFPLPVYPGLQVQRYEPIVLVHCAFTWQTEGEAVHSLMSEAQMNNKAIKKKKQNKKTENKTIYLFIKDRRICCQWHAIHFKIQMTQFMGTEIHD